ncbi:TPA: transposase family protein [Bacillus cereus]|uniref:transposase family protein n=1 Tax=Bacillus cereus group sp. FL70 TaxID=3040254 RepID=UPI0032F2E1A6|nr:transposase family protein [Bacillus cereus]HDR8115893.1 transposase family protein [Bacillus cereus]
MNIYEKSHKLSDSEFKRLIGVQRDTFEEMLQILRKAYAYIHQSRGRKSKLLIEEMLFVTLKYLRQYPTMKELAFEYNVAESTIHRTITWVEDILIRSRKFTLPSRKALVQSNSSIDYVLVDMMESPIERPKKNKRTTTQARKNITPSKHKSS